MTSLLPNRLIAFFDILGFSDQLRTTDVEQLSEKFGCFIDRANSELFTGVSESRDYADHVAKAHFVFDSIVLVSHPVENRHSVSDFLASCLVLMEEGFVQRWPLRGAIGLGDYWVDEDRGVFLSPALPSIVRMEAAQDWCGCCILPDCESLFIEVIKHWPINARSSPLIWYAPPFKHGACQFAGRDMLCINFTYLISSADLQSGLERLIEPKRAMTQGFIEYASKLPDDSIQLGDEFSPAVQARSVKMGYVFRVELFDAQGNSVDPPEDGTTITLSANGWSISRGAESTV